MTTKIADPIFECGECGDRLSGKKHGWLVCRWCHRRIHTTCMGKIYRNYAECKRCIKP